MSDRPIGFLRSYQIVPQGGIHPEVLAEPAVPCVGGPCDGQLMRCPSDRILILCDAVDGLRAVSLPPNLLRLSKDMGGYAGHYVRLDDTLSWVAP